MFVKREHISQNVDIKSVKINQHGFFGSKTADVKGCIQMFVTQESRFVNFWCEESEKESLREGRGKREEEERRRERRRKGEREREKEKKREGEIEVPMWMELNLWEFFWAPLKGFQKSMTEMEDICTCIN